MNFFVELFVKLDYTVFIYYKEREYNMTDKNLISLDDMPKPVKREIGLKCAFYWFDTYSKAQIGSLVALNHLSIRGRESIYNTPGTIYEEEDGLFRVTFP